MLTALQRSRYAKGPLRRPMTAAFGMSLVIGALGACGGEAAPEAERGVTREDVTRRGDELVGRMVTVSGVVNDTYGSGAAEIAGEGSFFDGAPVLVVGRNLPSAAAGARIEVTGTVRRFDLPELEREVGGDLPVDPDAPYSTAIVATEARILDPSGTFEDEKPSR